MELEHTLFTFKPSVYDSPYGPLGADFPQTIARARIQALGLSISVAQPLDPGTMQKSTSAVVFPPAVPDLLNLNSSPVKRPPIVLEGIGITVPGGPKMVNPSSFENVDPRGEWNVLLSKNFFQADATSYAGVKGNVLDIKLHITLSALLDSDPNEWDKNDFNF